MRNAREPGKVYQIELDDDCVVYAVEAGHAHMAFFDTSCRSIDDLKDLQNYPILFVLLISDDAPLDVWKEVGRIAIQPGEIPLPIYYKQSQVDPTKIFLVDVHWNKTPATYEEAKELEKTIVWSADPVEERLRDHYAGRINQVWKETRPKKPASDKEPGTSNTEIRLLDDDDAQDWLHRLRESSDPIQLFVNTVQEVHKMATTLDYVDKDRCAWGVAAGEVMAAAVGQPSDELPNFVYETVDLEELSQRDDLLELVRQILRMVGHGHSSELRELWSGSQRELSQWRSKIDSLLRRLR